MVNRIRRIIISAKLFLIATASERAEFLKKKNLFGYIGDKVIFQPRKLPLYSNLIFIHNNVKIASGVEFITHDVIYKMLNDKYNAKTFSERVGCIEIKDNVFVGAGTKIMYDTQIGSNVIIGAGSIVTKDIPDNSVYGGIPAKFICSFEDFVKKAEQQTYNDEKLFKDKKNGKVTNELSQALYKEFQRKRVR